MPLATYQVDSPLLAISSTAAVAPPNDAIELNTPLVSDEHRSRSGPR
jgi:hypothetical protein